MNNNSQSNFILSDNNENIHVMTYPSPDCCDLMDSFCQVFPQTSSPEQTLESMIAEEKKQNLQPEEPPIRNPTSSSPSADSSQAEVLDDSSDGIMSGLEVGSNRLGPALSYPCLPSVSAPSSSGSQTHPLPTPTSPLCNSTLNNEDTAHSISLSGSPPSPIPRSRSPGSSRRGSPSPLPFLGDGSGTSARISVGSTNSASSSSRETSVDKDNKDKAYLADLSVSENLSVEGAESGSGSARSLELPALKNADSSNGHKQAQQQRSSGKRKSTWYQMLNPTYRSRCEDFKRIFKDLPIDERLIVDYSCALQRDILLQGRIYVTQNYLCFYANIFRWETLVQIRWKEVTALTKEKTALVIPNAIQICTEAEKHFFCSFGTRDKTYVVLFRTWQQALLDQPLGNQELWKFVHSVYGEELGFSSNDELDVGITPSDTHPQQILQSSPSPSLHSAHNSNDDDSIKQLKLTSTNHREQPSHSDGQWSAVNGVTDDRLASRPVVTNDTNTRINDGMNTNNMSNNSPTDLSDTTESSEDERIGGSDGHISCPVNHEGRELVSVVFPLNIDDLFTLLFTNSSFYMEFLQGARKATDLYISPWQEAENPSEKVRQIAYTLPINNSMGVKSTRVSETQTLSSCSKPGELYIIDSDVSNGGIPYADTFYVGVHYCLLRYGHNRSKLVVHAQVKYKKSVWGIVKTFIEKNSIAGLEDHFTSLEQSLQLAHRTGEEEERKERRSELPHSPPPTSLATKNRHLRPQRRRRGAKDEPLGELRRGTHPPNGIGDPQIILKTTTMRKRVGRTATDVSSGPSAVLYFVLFGLIALLCVNGMLFTKLWALEELTEKLARKNPPQPTTPNMADIRILKSKPQTQEDWLELLRKQEAVYRNLESKWKVALSTISTLWQQTQVTLQKLEKELEPEANAISTILEEIRNRPVSGSADGNTLFANATDV